MALPTYGPMADDWETRIDYEALRRDFNAAFLGTEFAALLLLPIWASGVTIALTGFALLHLG